MNEQERADELWRRLDGTRSESSGQRSASAPGEDRELEVLSGLIPMVGEALSSDAQRSSTREHARTKLSEAIEQEESFRRRPPRKTLIWMSTATAAALLLAFTSLALIPRDSLHAGELVNDHIALLHDDVQHPARDAEGVSSWLESRVGFQTAPVSLDRQGARLLGGRHCRLKGLSIGLYLYRCRAVRLSLFQFSGDRNPLAGLDLVRVGGRRYFVGADKGFNIVAWEGRANFLALVASCDTPSLLKLAEAASRQTD
jgi:hypothetical protein